MGSVVGERQDALVATVRTCLPKLGTLAEWSGVEEERGSTCKISR